jgi:hypothetical protein
MKTILLVGCLAFGTCLATSAAQAKIIPQNWKSCHTGAPLRDDGKNDKASVPAWLLPMINPDDARLYALHGLCNEKFHRVVLCLTGWQEDASESWNQPWFKVCAAWELTH